MRRVALRHATEAPPISVVCSTHPTRPYRKRAISSSTGGPPQVYAGQCFANPGAKFEKVVRSPCVITDRGPLRSMNFNHPRGVAAMKSRSRGFTMSPESNENELFLAARADELRQVLAILQSGQDGQNPSRGVAQPVAVDLRLFCEARLENSLRCLVCRGYVKQRLPRGRRRISSPPVPTCGNLEFPPRSRFSITSAGRTMAAAVRSTARQTGTGGAGCFGGTDRPGRAAALRCRHPCAFVRRQSAAPLPAVGAQPTCHSRGVPTGELALADRQSAAPCRAHGPRRAAPRRSPRAQWRSAAAGDPLLLRRHGRRNLLGITYRLGRRNVHDSRLTIRKPFGDSGLRNGESRAKWCCAIRGRRPLLSPLPLRERGWG